jgi:hypothetical protein
MNHSDSDCPSFWHLVGPINRDSHPPIKDPLQYCCKYRTDIRCWNIRLWNISIANIWAQNIRPWNIHLWNISVANIRTQNIRPWNICCPNRIFGPRIFTLGTFASGILQFRIIGPARLHNRCFADTFHYSTRVDGKFPAAFRAQPRIEEIS